MSDKNFGVGDMLGGEFDDLRRDFLRHVQDEFASMKNRFHEGDLEAVRRSAHSLKGAAPMFGFDEIGEVAARIEEAAREGRAEQVEDGFAELESAYRKIREEAA
jgi:HPt (histidine-containing phosphotransfer) domain-containing protein